MYESPNTNSCLTFFQPDHDDVLVAAGAARAVVARDSTKVAEVIMLKRAGHTRRKEFKENSTILERRTLNFEFLIGFYVNAMCSQSIVHRDRGTIVWLNLFWIRTCGMQT